MLDVDTFLTALYVMVDDFRHSHPPTKRPGPKASLSQSEVITLAIFARWSRFSSERDFYRYASGHLREAFPTLPEQSQFNRSVRFYTQLLEKMALHTGRRCWWKPTSTPTKPWTVRPCPFETRSVGVVV